MRNDVDSIYRAYNAAENAHDVNATSLLVSTHLSVTINGVAELSSGADDDVANAALFAAYPDYQREIVEILSTGDRGTVRWIMRGTPASGSDLPNLELSGCSVVQVRDGQLVSAHLYADMTALRRILPRTDIRQGG